MDPQFNEKSNRTLGIDGNADLSSNEKIGRDEEAPESGESYDTGLTRDGVKMHPQPTADPLDPLNWSSWKKHSILGIVMWLYFLFTYITTTTVPSFPEIQTTYDITYSQVNWTVAIPALGLAFGPLFWSSLADIYGRRVIFISGTTIAFVATIGAAKASSYGGYMAARFFQGFGVSPGATVGMAIIGDMFFEYERGQKLGLWVLAIDSGLLVGPIIGGFMNIVGQFWVDWLTAILFAALLVVEVAFLPETLYPRNHMLSRMPLGTGAGDIEKTGRKMSSAGEVDLKRTTKLPFINVKPVPGMRHPKPWDSFGLLFLGLLLGTLFSEVFCSGRLSDWLVARLTKQNGGVRVAEMRLWLAYPAALLSAIGLIIWGISVDKAYHWIVGQIAFFLFAMGIQMGNTVITSYIVDCYPLQSMSVITFYSVFLNLSAFINPFFIAPWVTADGYTITFAVQGIITFFVSVPVFVAIHYWGPQLREKSGQPGWVNPEYDTL
ncbi:MAG: hypothetical protein M1827_006120 [Pycnora praestabilis]|nr:MAG: hypothetical protein M1827_006120 [Pycnora praestabilis]